MRSATASVAALGRQALDGAQDLPQLDAGRRRRAAHAARGGHRARGRRGGRRRSTRSRAVVRAAELGHLGERGGRVLLTQQAIHHGSPALVLTGDRLRDRPGLLGGRLAARRSDLRDHPGPDRPDETVLRPDPADDRLEPDACPLRDRTERDLVERALGEQREPRLVDPQRVGLGRRCATALDVGAGGVDFTGTTLPRNRRLPEVRLPPLRGSVPQLLTNLKKRLSEPSFVSSWNSSARPSSSNFAKKSSRGDLLRASPRAPSKSNRSTPGCRRTPCSSRSRDAPALLGPAADLVVVGGGLARRLAHAEGDTRRRPRCGASRSGTTSSCR